MVNVHSFRDFSIKRLIYDPVESDAVSLQIVPTKVVRHPHKHLLFIGYDYWRLDHQTLLNWIVGSVTISNVTSKSIWCMINEL